MNQRIDVPDYDVLKRDIETLRKRIEDLESGRRHIKATGHAPHWGRLFKSPAFVMPAIAVALLLTLGVLAADNKQDSLFIDQNGNVGINQTKPEAPLDVNGNTLLRGDLSLGNSIVYFTNTDHRTAATALQGGIAAIENSKDRGALELFGRSTPTRRRVVAVSDRLGVGTSFPNETLEVGGNAIVNGVLTVDQVQGIVTDDKTRLLRLGDRVGIGKINAEAPLDAKGEIRGALWTSPEYEWNPKDQGPTQMTKADHSACFLTSVHGGNVLVEIKRNERGYWVLTGHSEARGVRAKAKCIGAPDASW
jgi:hypothetical protein